MSSDIPDTSSAPDTTDVGEVPASTGGVVDLDRVLGNIPVVLVFMTDPESSASVAVMESLGSRLVDFGHERVQVLGVAATEQSVVMEAEDLAAGNARLLADEDGSVAKRFGVSYVEGSVVTVLIGADGIEGARWEDVPSGSIADELLERLDQQTT